MPAHMGRGNATRARVGFGSLDLALSACELPHARVALRSYASPLAHRRSAGGPPSPTSQRDELGFDIALTAVAVGVSTPHGRPRIWRWSN
jgi:hypothetical protein